MTDTITRGEWIESFKDGFDAGCSERRVDPESRRADVTDAKSDSFEVVEAAQAGYELGLNKGFPGAPVDVEKEANAAYDRSEHSAGLDDWT